MDNSSEMFSFSSKLWYNKRCISKDNTATVYVQVCIGSPHTEINLKLRWPQHLFDLAAGKLLPRYKGDTEVSDYNLLIMAEQAKHTEILRTYRLSNQAITIAAFKKELQVFDQRESFITFIERERNARFRKKDIEKQTWRNAGAVKMAIIQYDPLALFRDIDAKWMAGFKNHLKNFTFKFEGDPTPRHYKPGTIEDRMKTTKAYLKRASCEPMIYVNPEAIKFENPKTQVVTTFVNRDELRRLFLLLEGDITDKQERVLKGWLFMAFTSLRISDLYAATSDWSLSEEFLTFIPFKNRKSGKILKIPLLPMARRLISTTAGKFFVLPNSVDYNKTLKSLAEKAGISKRLTAHVARHTFGYLYMTTVGNLYGLKEILGHSKIETTQRYAHLDEDYMLATTKQIQGGFEDLMLRRVM